jgi:hypothetical protein
MKHFNQFMQHRTTQDEMSQLNLCNIGKHRSHDPATGTAVEDDVASTMGETTTRDQPPADELRPRH